jgi:hypothetical protein
MNRTAQTSVRLAAATLICQLGFAFAAQSAQAVIMPAPKASGIPHKDAPSSGPVGNVRRSEQLPQVPVPVPVPVPIPGPSPSPMPGQPSPGPSPSPPGPAPGQPVKPEDPKMPKIPELKPAPTPDPEALN